jgi:hypothetical protein
MKRKNIIESGRPQMEIRRTRIAYWIPKAKDTPSEYRIFIAFPPQQYLHESASVSHYTCIECLALVMRVYIAAGTESTATQSLNLRRWLCLRCFSLGK